MTDGNGDVTSVVPGTGIWGEWGIRLVNELASAGASLPVDGGKAVWFEVVEPATG